MTSSAVYKPKYDQSWAIVIGINEYQRAGRLGYACNDANAVAHQLTSRFDFPSENVQLLLDRDATRENVSATLLGLVDRVGPDDRVVVFYAGHGTTRTSQRGEVGFLVPVDGDPNKLGTLIRWDELTRNGDLLAAKHLLFIMDACYGGLAVTRALSPGSTRFARDMLSRYARQVLTAGKADEVVADSGGPRKGNSMFTGHLLDALEGAVTTTDGIISANAVMGYVYDRVAKDQYSRQSPHFGFLDGDGDLLFSVPDFQTDETKDTGDVLIKLPADLEVPDQGAGADPSLERVKEYLSEPRHRIRLDDFVTRQVRSVQARLGGGAFPMHGQTITPTDIAERLAAYEGAMSELAPTTVVLGRWADREQQSALARVVTGLADLNGVQSGLTIWLGMRWYPLVLAQYYGGIAAIAGGNYPSLATLLMTRVGSYQQPQKSAAVESAVEGMLEVDRANGFKSLPGHERHFVPRSEYIFKRVQATLDDTLFLGIQYEEIYDRFEILYSLAYADLSGAGWGPPGRFAWKYKSTLRSDNPFTELLNEAKPQGNSWPPLQGGLFGGDYERFESVAKQFEAQALSRLPFY